MLNLFLYVSTALIWGSTWLAIKLQLTQVPPILSVSYRFCLAAFILLVYCWLTRKRLKFSLQDHSFMMVQGFSLFGLSYICSYMATAYMTSGLVAVIFSTILLWNIINLRIFMRQPVAWRALYGGILGLVGICIVFWNDLVSFSATRSLIGLLIAIAGAYLASLGNVVGSRNAKRGVPVTQANAFGMAYGGLLTLFIHFGMGGRLTIDWSIGDGYDVPIEERAANEVIVVSGLEGDALHSVQTVADDTPVANYAFDMTPSRLVTGLITERGICAAGEAGLANLVPERAVA